MKLNKKRLQNVIAEAIEQNYQERNLSNIDGIQDAVYDTEDDNPLDNPSNTVVDSIDENRLIKKIVRESMHRVLRNASNHYRLK